jgi:oligoendopeptidase F
MEPKKGIVMPDDKMAWDLSQLVKSSAPASIQNELEKMGKEAVGIREKYRGKIGSLNGEKLREFLELSDALILRFEGVRKFCYLAYSANSTDEVAKQLNDAVRRADVKVGQALAFVDVELGQLLAKKPSLITDSVLTEYRHFLERKQRRVPHILSETEERLIIAKDRNGIGAWEKLQSDWLSTRTFDIEVDGEVKTLPYGKIIGFYQSPNRDLRRRANQVVYETLGKDEILWASAIRAVCEDHMQMCELRKYPSPMTQSLIANDVDQRAIDSLMKTIEKNVHVYQKYLRLKADMMGLEKLANYDIVAPLPDAPEMAYSWEKSRVEILKACREFDEEIAGWVTEMYEKRHIDGEVRRGKESGAFCAGWMSGKSAYILQSFNGRMGDVYTQAHELGHAIHAYLTSRAQKISNCDIGSCIAETGSIFSELLLTEQLLSEAKTKAEKQAILSNVLDEFGMAAFQVSARVFFEKAMYNNIKQKKLLDGETVARLWAHARDKIYGDAVEWLDVMKWEWTMKPHYYMANYRFYNYPYVYAQLFVFALYRLYKEEGKAFVPKLKKLLASGSSKSPYELAMELGFDVNTEEFWEKGIEQAEKFISMLEATLNS